MSWIDKILPSGVNKDESANRTSVPEGLWKKCVKCDAIQAQDINLWQPYEPAHHHRRV